MKKKILVTGATGFIGSHLSELLVRKGFKVVAFDRYNPNSDYGWLKNSNLFKDIEIILGDITVTAGFIVSILVGVVFGFIYDLIGFKSWLDPIFENSFLYDSD